METKNYLSALLILVLCGCEGTSNPITNKIETFTNNISRAVGGSGRSSSSKKYTDVMDLPNDAIEIISDNPSEALTCKTVFRTNSRGRIANVTYYDRAGYYVTFVGKNQYASGVWNSKGDDYCSFKWRYGVPPTKERCSNFSAGLKKNLVGYVSGDRFNLTELGNQNIRQGRAIGSIFEGSTTDTKQYETYGPPRLGPSEC